MTEVLQPVVDGLLAQPKRRLLTVGVVFTLWTASSGVQSVGTLAIALVFGRSVLLPYVGPFARHAGAGAAHMAAAV